MCVYPFDVTRLAAVVSKARGTDTQEDFARAVGVHVTVVQRIERGNPSEQASKKTVAKLVAQLPAFAAEIQAAVEADGAWDPTAKRGRQRATSARDGADLQQKEPGPVRSAEPPRSAQQQPKSREGDVFPDDPMLSSIVRAWPDLEEKQRRDLAARAAAGLPTNKRKRATPKAAG
jgi:hypothetical protein